MAKPEQNLKPQAAPADNWKSALVGELSEHIFSDPETRLGVVSRGVVVFAVSLAIATGLLYWRHPEVFSGSYYHESPIELQLERLPEHQRRHLLSYTTQLHEQSGAEWTAVFDWRTLKDVQIVISHGNVPSQLLGWHSLPQNFQPALSEAIYERCFGGHLPNFPASEHTVVCPILGDEDVWGYIVIHSPSKMSDSEVMIRLRALASRWSDYLY